MKARGKGTQKGQARRNRQGLSLWLGSAMVGLTAFGLAWGLQHALIRNGTYALMYLQSVLAYDRGMTQHAYVAAKDSSSAQPVTVLEIGKTTYDWTEATDFTQEPGSPFQPGRPARFQVYQRWFHTRVLRNLQKLGARVVVFDVVFDGEDPELDPAFAAAIQDHGKVILAAANDTGQERGGEVVRTKGLEYPSGELLAASAGLGLANVPQDTQGKISQFPWGATGIDYDTGEDTIIPSLGVAAAALYGGVSPKAALTDPKHSGGVFLGRRVSSLGGKLPERISYITYFGPAGMPAGPDSVLRYEDLFDLSKASLPPEQLRARIKDRIVIIGSAAATDQDIHRVPVVTRGAMLGDSQNMPGVETQAHIAQTVLSGKYVDQADETALVLLLLLSCLTVALAGRVLNPRLLVLISGGLIWALCWASGELLSSSRLWMEPVTAAIGVALAALGETLYMYVAERRQRLHAKRQLSRHVGPGVANKLTDDDWPELGGESMEVTLFFSDLQGFTTLSEGLSSPEICKLLNEYCGVIFPILDQYQATLDKVMGDGIMAYFGAIPRYPDHAARAVRCSIEIQRALDAWQALPRNRHLPPLKTRVGLHTGLATLGEIGAEGRVEFTVIGDIVNVASRLEGMNKEFGTRILISEATRLAAGEIAPIQFRGEAKVRGKSEPMPVYSVETEQIAAGAGV
ncbi:MAG: CHASE2 domain-containing protein [Actinomycetota bacterium]